MSTFLKYFAFFAVAIGLLFGRQIGRWLIYKFDPPAMENDGDLYVKDYISNLDTVHLCMTDRKNSNLYFEVRSKFNSSSSSTSAYVDKFETTFYDENRKKHFKIIYFFPVNSFFSSMYGYFLNDLHESEKNKNIVATVDIHDMDDPTFGVETNPVIIFYYIVPNLESRYYDSIQGDKGDKRFFHGSEAEFQAYQTNVNVKYYLSYIMPKNEFEKRFEKN